MPVRDASTSDLLTSEQVLDRLAAEPDLKRLAARCVLRAIRIGNSWWFRRSELDAWIERESRE